MVFESCERRFQYQLILVLLVIGDCCCRGFVISICW